MAPPFEIVSCEYVGRTDNSGDDALYVVHMRELGGEPEKFRFTHARYAPETDEIEAMIHERASGLDNYRPALEQFRALEVPHPSDHPWRRAVVLTRATV
jgi:hypothetical protein